MRPKRKRPGARDAGPQRRVVVASNKSSSKNRYTSSTPRLAVLVVHDEFGGYLGRFVALTKASARRDRGAHELSRRDFLVIGAIAARMTRGKKQIVVADAEIAKFAGISTKSVARAKRRLVAAGLLTSRQRGRGPNSYRLGGGR